MATVDSAANQATLDSLRIVQSRLFSMSEPELTAMSAEDQVKHADSLNQISIAILKLETAQLKDVNDAFKQKEQELKAGAANLEKDVAALVDAVKVVEAVAQGIALVTNIVKLLG